MHEIRIKSNLTVLFLSCLFLHQSMKNIAKHIQSKQSRNVIQPFVSNNIAYKTIFQK